MLNQFIAGLFEVKKIQVGPKAIISTTGWGDLYQTYPNASTWFPEHEHRWKKLLELGWGCYPPLHVASPFERGVRLVYKPTGEWVEFILNAEWQTVLVIHYELLKVCENYVAKHPTTPR